MAVRTARTAWNGTLMDGKGQVELTSSGTGTFDVSFPRRTADAAEGVTSPEELIAAAHSSCYAMAFSGELGKAGGTPEQVEISADVTVEPDPAGGIRISTVALTVRGFAGGVDEAGFKAAAEAAKVGCPVSKALTGVDSITLDVTFEG
ncbi:OsmC family peroxiredoxin [Myceligenerans xiligouense]|uniref:Osmotically inducible protein OsmC n=1 Tax=Myceligenerans xiligouense TaxID=253184 RepID=A0A3N4YK15_9MICO|nr:OsmC family peroxiredoxin [Myceligenerans xiligouense]RPF19756.1 osmotically inducible protein OsmC [Myceligenerans xiligouense]